QLMVQNPFVQQNEGRLWNLSKLFLESVKHPNLFAIIGPEPQDSAHPPMNADKEHLLFDAGIYRDARLDDDHEAHLQQHGVRAEEARLEGKHEAVKLIL